MSPQAGQSDRGRPHGIPARIGSYEVQRVIGAGGMATVYAALQRQPRRTVAVKVMRHGAEADVALRRFRREIEILGKLRHPFIAQVYEAGVHQDEAGPVPFLVMEYVPRAKTIIEYANKHELSVRDRLMLFVKVCAGVEHGHHKRILHRDLKPGNILIDERGEPKVIDYGVARAAEIEVTGHTLHTEAGRLIGTIQYMAPEQLDTSRPNLTPACDVYALGVVLFRLLTGAPPHDLKGMPVFIAAQVIKEDPPARPTKLNPELKGDLETIMLKALAKDPRRRYPDAGSLGRDLLRYLTRKPIRARDAGFAYRLMLFLRRHRTEVIAAGVVALVIAAAALVVTRMNGTGGDDETASTPPVETVAGTTPPPDDGSEPAAPERTVLPLSGLTGSVTALAFSPDDAQLAGGDAAGWFALWDVTRGATTAAAREHKAPIAGIAFEDGAIRTVGDDRTINRLDRATGRFETDMTYERSGVDIAAMTGDGRFYLFGRSGSMNAQLYDATGEDIGSGLQPMGGQAFTALAFNRGGTKIAGGSRLGSINAWDTTKVIGSKLGARYASIDDALDTPVMAITFVDDSDVIAAIAQDGTGVVWNPGERPSRIGGDGQTIDAAAFDHAGRWVAWAGGGRARVADLRDVGDPGQEIELPEGAVVVRIAVSSDGRWCAVGDESGAVNVYPVGE